MIIHPDAVLLSRIQFAMTAMFHFIFVPLTLGLSWILLIMETVYVITNKVIYKDMTRFWGKLFGINLAMAVITGVTLEFQFGTNWAFYSQYVGDIFGVPLAVEGMTAFMLEAAFFGLFFFGWERVSKTVHWISTLALAIGASLSALVILVANGWMQHPVGTAFNYHTMRMELTSWNALWFNPDAQVRFVHTISAGYVTGAIFVLAISAWYILRKRDLAFAKRSFSIAAGFGLAAVLSVIILGDQNGLNVNQVQPPKMAAMEGVWNTPKPPAAWSIIAIPDQKAHKNIVDLKVPWMLSLITHHDLHSTVTGLNQIIEQNKTKIRSGMKAYVALQKLRAGDKNPAVLAAFNRNQKYLGYGLLLKQYTADVGRATTAMINKAANNSIPNVAVLYWCFRAMVAAGILMLLLFAAAVLFGARGTLWNKRWLFKAALWCMPLPWIASECGWVIAEMGRQPWTVYGVLPTFLSSSSLSTGQVWTSLIGLFIIFGGLAIVEVILMIKYIRLGPSSLHTGRYRLETPAKSGEQ